MVQEIEQSKYALDQSGVGLGNGFTPVSADLQLGLASSNPRKIEQFQRDLPEGTGVQITPLFDEDDIKRRLHLGEQDGIVYATAISRAKLNEQRENQRREEPGVDYAILVSDSVVVIDHEGRQRAVNRDLNTGIEDQEIMDAVNKDGKVTYVGAVSFGRKEGKSAFTVSTYATIPLGEQVTTWPLEVDRLPQLKDPNGHYEVGYISYRVSDKGIIEPVREPVMMTEDFDEARPYISGLTREVKAFAHEAALFDRDTAQVLEDVIENKPFNTVSFYAAAQEHGDLAEFYKELAQDSTEFFDRFGGNCSLFTLDLAKRLQESEGRVAIGLYPALNRSDDTQVDDGHSAVLVKHRGRNYFFDPGLSVPFAVPYGEIPVAPFIAGDKSILVGVDSGEKAVPDMLVLKVNGRVSTLEGQRLVSVDQFRDVLPGVFQQFHEKRNELKIDFHGRDGSKKIGFLVDRKTEALFVKLTSGTVSIKLEELSDPSTAEMIKQLCDYHGVDDALVLGELTKLLPALQALQS